MRHSSLRDQRFKSDKGYFPTSKSFQIIPEKSIMVESKVNE